MDNKRWGEIRSNRIWTKPFLIFGRNAITAYIVAWFIAVSLFLLHVPLNGKTLSGHDYSVERFFAPLGSPSFTSLLFALAFVLLCLLPIWLMDRKKIFLKI
jgi:predicted acyltransferase